MRVLKNKKGMGMYEILAVTIILSIVLTSVSTVLITATRTTVMTKTKTQADYAITAYNMILNEDLKETEAFKTYLTTTTNGWDEGDDFTNRAPSQRIYISNFENALASTRCIEALGSDSETYLALYDSDPVIQIGDSTYNGDNVIIEISNIQLISSTAWNVTINVSVEYFESRTVGGDDVVIYING